MEGVTNDSIEDYFSVKRSTFSVERYNLVELGLTLEMVMNQIDELAHLIQLSIARAFLLTGIGTLLNVLSGRLARIIDRARVLEATI